MMQMFFLRTRKLVYALSTALTARALLSKWVLAGFEHRSVLTCGPFKTVVDIGANRGQFSLACRVLNPDCTIFAFEPLAGPAHTFKALLGEDVKVRLFQAAVGPKQCAGLMHITAKSDSSSLLAVGERQVDLFPGSVEIDTVTVPVVRLAEAIAEEELVAPALLKLDVQGYELQVLKGCSDRLKLFAHVYVECSFVELYTGQSLASEVIAHLHTCGFDLTGVYNTYYDFSGMAIQADLHFQQREAACVLLGTP